MLFFSFFYFIYLFIYFAVDWFFLKSINNRVMHTQNVTDIVYIVKLWKLFCCFLLFSTFQFLFNEYGVLSYFFLLKEYILFIYFFTLQYCMGFFHTSTWIRHRCARVLHPEPPPTSLPIPSLWVIPVHQPRACCIMHWTWTGDLFHIW